jgi:transcriptional regulator with XRE-family HTH domain
MTVSQLEKGQVALTPTKLAKLAQLYGLSVADLQVFQPAPVADQQAQTLEHLLARLAAVERELQQKDQTLAEMGSFFSALGRLLRDSDFLNSITDSRLTALVEIIRKFGQTDDSAADQPMRNHRSATASKRPAVKNLPNDLGEQLLQVLLRGIGLGFLVHLQHAGKPRTQLSALPLKPAPPNRKG